VSYKVCKDQVKTQVFLVSVIMGVAYAFIYLFIGCVINTVGKKKLMIAFVVVTTITGLCSQFVYGYGLIQILIGIFLMGGAGIGITNAIAVDLFPTQVRGMALAVSLMFGRIGAMTGTNIVGPLIYNVCDYLFYFVAADHLGKYHVGIDAMFILSFSIDHRPFAATVKAETAETSYVKRIVQMQSFIQFCVQNVTNLSY
jgi:MFS family permease